jgi:hypothetical protein
MSISCGAATTGTPLTTSKEDIQSLIHVVAQHAPSASIGAPGLDDTNEVGCV